MEIQATFVGALKGSIIEKYQKQGVTNIEALRKLIDAELPQLICDHVNTMLREAYLEGARESRAQLEEFCHQHGIIVLKENT